MLYLISLIKKVCLQHCSSVLEHLKLLICLPSAQHHKQTNMKFAQGSKMRHSHADSSLKDCQTAMDVPKESLKIYYKEADGTVLFESYIPPSRDAIHLPTYALYLLIAVFTLLGVLYAIIGHLIKDLIHDFAGE